MKKIELEQKFPFLTEIRITVRISISFFDIFQKIAKSVHLAESCDKNFLAAWCSNFRKKIKNIPRCFSNRFFLKNYSNEIFKHCKKATRDIFGGDQWKNRMVDRIAPWAVKWGIKLIARRRQRCADTSSISSRFRFELREASNLRKFDETNVGTSRNRSSQLRPHQGFDNVLKIFLLL